jgi:nucleotide-binding universal stress UspA family protein
MKEEGVMITQPIVVGVDGSPESVAAASAAWMVADLAGVPCRLVHAANDVSAALEFAGTGVATETLQLAALSAARARVSASLKNAVPGSVVDAMVVSIGTTAEVLEAVIRETDAALLVLGGKHHSTLGRWLGGSTVQQVVRRVTIPLLVTAGELARRPRVMVAVDQSYAAMPAVDQAVAFARILGTPLHALHVVDRAPGIAELPPNWSRDIVERDIWPRIPLVEQGKVIREGAPFTVIVDEAVAWRADVIVVGSHGKGWVDRMLIGSVTEDLLNNLPCAVLVVPVRKPERQRVPVPATPEVAAG